MHRYLQVVQRSLSFNRSFRCVIFLVTLCHVPGERRMWLDALSRPARAVVNTTLTYNGTDVFGKQIDKLKPYSKNSFILQDFNFKFLGRLSSMYPIGSADKLENFVAAEAQDR